MTPINNSNSPKEILKRINNYNIDNHVMSFLYSNVKKTILSYIIRNNGSRDDSNDIFQDSLISFLVWVEKKKEKNKRENKNERLFENIEQATGLLEIIAKRKWIDKLRENRNELSINDFFLENHAIDNAPNEEQIIAIIKKALTQISPKCREELEKFYLGDRLSPEINVDFYFNLSKTTKYRCMDEFKKVIEKIILNGFY